MKTRVWIIGVGGLTTVNKAWSLFTHIYLILILKCIKCMFMAQLKDKVCSLIYVQVYDILGSLSIETLHDYCLFNGNTGENQNQICGPLHRNVVTYIKFFKNFPCNSCWIEIVSGIHFKCLSQIRSKVTVAIGHLLKWFVWLHWSFKAENSAKQDFRLNSTIQ